MTIKVDFAALFLKQLQRLDRKYPRVTDEVDSLVNQLEKGELPGDKIPHVGYDVHKVRLKNPAAGRGKSGGFRVIYYIQTADSIILLTIYAKSQQEDISLERIRRVIADFISDEKPKRGGDSAGE